MRKLWTFSKGSEGFRYADDIFRQTDAPREAQGGWGAGRGFDGGGLSVRLSGDDDTGGRASGGWQTTFSLRDDQNLTLSFRVKISHDGPAAADDLTQILAAIDGDLRGVRAADFAVRLRGEAEAGWQTVTVSLGALEAGRHTLSLGGYHDTGRIPADVSIRLDDVTLTSRAPLGDFEAEVLRLTNAFRARHGLDPLQNDLRLNDAAENWSRQMARGDIFEHSKGPEQVEKQGYDWSHWGENIAAGYATPKDVVDGWINSPGHRANMLSKEFTEIGIGYYHMAGDGGDAPYTHYWTQEFGTPDTLL